MVSNIIFDILGNFQISTKFGPLDPLFIVEMVHKYKQIPSTFLGVIIIANLRINISNMLELRVPIFWNVVFMFVKPWNVDCDCLKCWSFEIRILRFSTFWNMVTLTI